VGGEMIGNALQTLKWNMAEVVKTIGTIEMDTIRNFLDGAIIGAVVIVIISLLFEFVF
tara:strand:- start:543 stop:716 length:174 start_codon:yes stop_codon:yes gene_type:complete